MARFLCAADMQQIDPLNLATCIRNLETQGADELHFDVADGRFISQFGFSTDMIAAAKAGRWQDVALQMQDSAWYSQVPERAKRLVRIIERC